MKKTAALLFCVFFPLSLSAQKLAKMEFRDQSIVDILMVLAEATGNSIVPDETIVGNASFFFSEAEFEDALSLFLAAYRLHFTKANGVYYVSKIEAAYDKEKGLVTLKADETALLPLVRALSKTMGTTILYDPLPAATLTVNIAAATPEQALEILAKRFPEYVVEREAAYFYLRRLPSDQQKAGAAKAKAADPIVRNGDRYSVSLEKGRFLETLAQLFSVAGKEYSFLLKTDTMLENLYFTGRDFEGILRLLLEQGGGDYVVKDGVYYILELQRRDVVKKLKKTTTLPLRHIPVQDLPNLLPADLASGNLLRTDKTTNVAFLTGTDEELAPILDFIALIDVPLEGKRYERFDAKFMKAKDLLGLIPPKLIPLPPAAVPDSNSFVALGSEENLAALRSFIAIVDRKRESYPVRLRYLKTEDLLKALPPSIQKEEIQDSGTPNLLFFIGSEEKRQVFLRELALMDRPKPQLRYELLVIQYLKSDGKTMKRSARIDTNPEEETNAFVGNLSNLLTLNFDAVDKFGYQFAAALSVEIGENTAKVFADTTLHGISAQEVKFQNTETFRYQEFEVDDDTGKVTDTGVTREITSGLIIGLNGWISGDDMITMAVNATVSKRNAASSTSTSTLPSTSERVVTTQVRTPSGKPIVVSGLMQTDTNVNIQKIPILGDIPLLGRLFRDEKESVDQSEMVIYIVPYLSRADTDQAESVFEKTERYYRAFVADYR